MGDAFHSPSMVLRPKVGRKINKIRELEHAISKLPVEGWVRQINK